MFGPSGSSTIVYADVYPFDAGATLYTIKFHFLHCRITGESCDPRALLYADSTTHEPTKFR